jgi:hypothetical protein
MRGTEHSKKLYKFDIGKHGIILNKKSCKEVI